MICSSERKLCLSGWLKQNSEKEYASPLKLQKYLLLYEAFSKMAGEKADFTHLRGYKRGSVFSNVQGDYTKERVAFDKAVMSSYATSLNAINLDRARKSAFIVGSLSEKELSEFTHKLNLWKAKEDRILSGEYQVDLDEADFNQHDEQLIKILDQMYPSDMVNNSTIFELDDHYFVFAKDDIKRLTEQHFDTLSVLAEQEMLENPVYVEIDEGGHLVVD